MRKIEEVLFAGSGTEVKVSLDESMESSYVAFKNIDDGDLVYIREGMNRQI